MNGWVSPRCGIRFELDDSDLRIVRPDGRPFETYVEVTAAPRTPIAARRRKRRRAEEADHRATEERRLAEEADHRAAEERRRAEEADHRAGGGTSPAPRRPIVAPRGGTSPRRGGSSPRRAAGGETEGARDRFRSLTTCHRSHWLVFRDGPAYFQNGTASLSASRSACTSRIAGWRRLGGTCSATF